MGKFDGFLFCTDIDGTLTNSEGRISDKDLSAIEYYMSEGGLFTVATGRFSDFISGFQIKPNAPIVALNGTTVYDCKNDTELFSFRMNESCEEPLKYILNNLSVKNLAVNIADPLVCTWCEKKDFDIKKTVKSRPNKILIISESEKETAENRRVLKAKYKGIYNFERSWDAGLEMYSIKAGKGESIMKLKNEYLKSVHTVITAGNYENDISMLTLADYGYAPNNSIDEVKKAATAVVPDNDHNAISYIIEHIEI